MKQILSNSVIAVTILLSDCNFKTEVKQDKNVVTLPDYSDSRDSAAHNFYKEVISNSVIGHLGFFDRTTALPIDKGSSTSSQEIFTADFSLNDYVNQFAGLDGDGLAMESHKDSLTSAKKRFSLAYDLALVSRKEFANATDIVGAIQQAKKYYLPGHNNILVILSDMLISVDSIDFENHLNNEEDIKYYLTKVDTVDLKDWKIIILTGTQPNITTQKYNTVKTFWERYIKSCHGELVDYSSGAVTKLEQVISK